MLDVAPLTGWEVFLLANLMTGTLLLAAVLLAIFIDESLLYYLLVYLPNYLDWSLIMGDEEKGETRFSWRTGISFLGVVS